MSSTTPAVLLEDKDTPAFLTMDSIKADEDDPETSAALNIESDHTTVPVGEESGTVDYCFRTVCACPITTGSCRFHSHHRDS